MNLQLIAIARSQAHICAVPQTRQQALQAIKEGIGFLSSSPFACRKVGECPFIRELVITFGRSGYVALYEIVDDSTVIIGAIRHQREDDYH